MLHETAVAISIAPEIDTSVPTIEGHMRKRWR
jgi:hypothetical protein